MDILSKLEHVEIESVKRISEEDKKFCMAHQAAYEAAISALSELQFFWEDILKIQARLLEGTGSPANEYVYGNGSLVITPQRIQEHSNNLHNKLIFKLVHYFNNLYKINIDAMTIIDKLIPSEPKYRLTNETQEEYDQRAEQYNASLQKLSLAYDDILEHIFSQMDGRGLTEQAVHELKSKCHNAVWFHYNKPPQYELCKETIRFTGYFCSHKGNDYSSPWELYTGMKNILRGAIHFETGSVTYIPENLAGLFGYSYRHATTLLNGKKILQVKLFKNGRADLKFASQELAKEFMEDYLGTVY